VEPTATPPGGAQPGLSIVIPCFNAARDIRASLDALSTYLERLPYSWEIVLVDDGSRDATAEILAARVRDPRIVLVVLERNRGKGRAVAEGMARARGACRIFTDQDLPYRLGAVARCAELVLERDHPVVFGNRLLAGSDAGRPPALRRLAGACVRAATGRLLDRTDVDTQCGFKGFSAPVADALFPLLRIDGFLFDVEAALLLQRAGVPITFVPVELVNDGRSTVRLVRTSALTLREAWGIWREALRRERDISALRALAAARAAARGSAEDEHVDRVP